MMNTHKLKIGRYVRQKEGYSAFTPYPFPSEGGFLLSPRIYKKHEEAARLIGKLDGVSARLPDIDFFLLMFITKDAAYSSQIEGTKATMQDAVAAPVTDPSQRLHPDVDDITHYVGAVKYGMERIEQFPLSLRFIRELHERLMGDGARATQHAYPGEFRRSQNWIGGNTISDATFVPPAPHDMQDALSQLELFMHADDEYPLLVKAGLLHAQFETIHPFTDGNGRTGRMLVALYLHHVGVLELPVLYLSHYFKKHQKTYYQKLDAYHIDDADIEGWISFFLDGVIATATSAIDSCAQVVALRDRDFAKMQKLGKRSASSTLEVVRMLFGQPIVGVAEIMKWTGFSQKGAYQVIDRLVELQVLEPLGDKAYGQKYIYGDYYEIFDDLYRSTREKK